MQNIPEIFDTQTLANITGQSESRFEKLRLRGGGPAYLKLGKSVRYRRADVLQWLNAQVARSTSEGA
jgi:predicted DNA-binding transcriptional regulator AlpA